MAQCGQRKCLCCEEFFFPDCRNVGRQRYCSKPDCRRASKAASQAAWLSLPGNVDYFKGPVHVQRVREWRAANPGRRHRRPHAARALQDPLPAQAIDFVEQNADRGETPGVPTLQDLLNPSMALLAGLVAQVFDVTLQDDMVETIRRLVQRGQDLLIVGVAGDEDRQARGQTPHPARAPAPGARAVQLD